jgi:hypothetical protein
MVKSRNGQEQKQSRAGAIKGDEENIRQDMRGEENRIE